MKKFKINNKIKNISKAKARKQLEKLLASGKGSKSKIKRLKKRINKRSKPHSFEDKVNSWRKKLHIVSGSFEQGKRR